MYININTHLDDRVDGVFTHLQGEVVDHNQALPGSYAEV